MRLVKALVVACLTLAAVRAQAPKPGEAELNRAYRALAQKDYDTAIALFRQGLAQQPNNASGHKDLAYTLLKAGENEQARDEFEAAIKADPHDDTAALEYAFLAFETKKPIEARRIFDRLRHSENPATRTTAEHAFENIDQPLADGIARWEQALARAANPNDISTFSAHWELAQLAERRDNLLLAAEQYEICHKLKPQLPELLLILGRIWHEMGRIEESRAALLAASRSSDSRTAELALEQMDSRYPYPYEFLDALKLDPTNVALRRELAFLYLAMQRKPEAIAQFKQVLAIDPDDRISRDQLDTLQPGLKSRTKRNIGPDAASTTDAKALGEKSLALGYLPDAIKYLREAHEEHPDDAEIMLQLGWAYNEAKNDAQASSWFDQARRAGDTQIAAQALRAYRNLNSELFPQTTIWVLPMYSSRWNDMFTYGQIKRSIPLPWKRADKLFSLYLSTRFDGDLRGHATSTYGPNFLSEGAIIPAVGISSKTWHHLTLYAEAGEALFYKPVLQPLPLTPVRVPLYYIPFFLQDRTPRHAKALPDYRSVLDFSKGFGKLLGSSQPGFFYETTDDAEYLSAFNYDLMFYLQNRVGRTLKLRDHSSLQALMNVNYTRDIQGQYWANTLETGPGTRFRLPWMSANTYLSVDILHGWYLNGPYVDEWSGPHKTYTDIRVAFWFGRTK